MLICNTVSYAKYDEWYGCLSYSTFNFWRTFRLTKIGALRIIRKHMTAYTISHIVGIEYLDPETMTKLGD